MWVERAFPERRWIIANVFPDTQGARRIVVEPVEDRTLEAVYTEPYFRRHFIDRHQWLRRENERVLKQAQRKDSVELLHEMAQINAR